MDGSKLMLRRLQQLQVSHHSYLRSFTPSTVRESPPRQKTSRPTTISSSRAFSTSPRSPQDEPSQISSQIPSQAQTQQTISPPSPQPRPQSKQQHQQQQQQQQQPQRRPPKAIDLSSITTNPSYKPPIRQPQQTLASNANATAALDQLVAKTRDKVRAQNAASAASSQSNYDLYGSGKTTLFGRTTNRTGSASQYGATGAAKSNIDILQDIRRDLNASQASNTSIFGSSSLLSPTGQLNLRGPPEPVLRLKPTLGKTLDVSENVGLVRAFQMLENRINKNGNAVKREERQQKFHIRQGQKSKIERRQRWRIVFKEGFLGECARVRKMIRQGW